MKTTKILTIVMALALFTSLLVGGSGSAVAEEAGGPDEAVQNDSENQEVGKFDEGQTIPLKVRIDGEEKRVDVVLPRVHDKARPGVKKLASFVNHGIIQGKIMNGLLIVLMAFFLLVLSMRIFPGAFDSVRKTVNERFLASLLLGAIPVVILIFIGIFLILLANAAGQPQVRVVAVVLLIFLLFIVGVLTLLTAPSIVEGLGRKLIVDSEPDEETSEEKPSESEETGEEDADTEEECDILVCPMEPGRFKCLMVGTAFIGAIGWFPIFGWLLILGVVAVSWGAAATAMVKK